MDEKMAVEKIDIPIKFNVTTRMWARIDAVLKQCDYTQSEYMRELIRKDLKARDLESVSLKLAQAAMDDSEQNPAK